MPPPHLHLIALDPGGTTGWVWLKVPRASVYGREDGSFLEWDQGQFEGPEEKQVQEICRFILVTQSLDYPVGPAVVCEDWDIMPTNVTTDPEMLSPARIGAMLRYAFFRGDAGKQARLVFQPRTLAMQHMTDDRLEAIDMYVPGEEHARDAMRHAITALRRAKKNPELRDEMWKKV